MSTFPKKFKVSDAIVGIDFGTTKIVVIVGKVTSEGVEIVGIGKQPSIGIRKGVVVNIPNTVEAIKKATETAERMAGIKIASAYAGIAGGHIKGFNSTGVVAIKTREVTSLDVERAIEAAKAVAVPLDREVIHVIPQEYVVDDQDGVRDPIGMSGVRLEAKVHIVTGAVSSAQNIIKCTNKAGIEVSDIILEPLASSESVLARDEKELGVALVDIGGGTTDIAIFVRGSLVHTSIIPMGGNHITNDIAVGLRTSIHDAENIKLSHGSVMESHSEQDVKIEVPLVGGRKPKEIYKSTLTKIIEPRVEEILSLVNQEIVQSGFKHLLSAGIVFTGGTSELRGLLELGEFVIELPVRKGLPQGMGGLLEEVNSPMYATAVGLLQYGIRNPQDAGFSSKEEPIYGKVVSRMRAWLSDVF